MNGKAWYFFLLAAMRNWSAFPSPASNSSSVLVQQQVVAALQSS
jgi:hypothetical protein